MSRSRLLLRIAALVLLAGCHTGEKEEVRAPTTHHTQTTETTSASWPSDPSIAVQVADAKTALNAAGPGLRSCRAEGGPSVVDVTLRFEPSGKVSKIVLQPESANIEPVASCLRSKLSQIELMPFEGTPIAISSRLNL